MLNLDTSARVSENGRPSASGSRTASPDDLAYWWPDVPWPASVSSRLAGPFVTSERYLTITRRTRPFPHANCLPREERSRPESKEMSARPRKADSYDTATETEAGGTGKAAGVKVESSNSDDGQG